MRNFSVILVLWACLGSAQATAEPAALPTVVALDLQRYAGAWYEIALLPNRFQKQCVADTQARYRLDGDRVEVINRCRTAKGELDRTAGHAKVVEGSANAKLKVTFFWPFYGNYWVLDLDKDYSQVLIGEPSRKYAWILSRTPQMDETALQKLLDRAAELGFERAAFQRTPQTQPLD
ncbi:lipocalin family protein [Roseateles oligotrophus]|uniref:Outer membrane lipoprotein Blc n=1 Tax=Roseateles oligotrophus TaxID=1769250 RepID=A0ABT2YCS5_9BURK|nr:lipocalin family protein [Roseateles oligotrophus]MCV2367845.1 lipocalin family protein [Roseateles oligotrophus]